MNQKNLIKKIIPTFLLDSYHYSLAAIGAFLYWFPSKKLTVIGITGTSGKSTVVELTAKVFEEALRQSQGKQFKVASLSSIKFKIGEKEWENRLKMTMPGRMKLQRFLKQAVKAGCEYAVLEVTSEGIKQYRHKFIDFGVAVLTNLSPEHLETHGGFEKYRKAKLKLFKVTKNIHIVNIDDKNADYFLKIPAEKKIGYSIKLKAQNSKLKTTTQNLKFLRGENIEIKPNGIIFEVQGKPFQLSLSGIFNIYNALAAVCIALSQGISLEVCKRALEKVKGIPGRMEVVIKEPFTVIVDYAHTPQSLKKVYETLRTSNFQLPNSKLICVLGACGGGRDKWKRPVLGKIAAEYCQEIIVTNEDPYNEDPMEIIEQVAEGAKGKAQKILDRREAIRKALALARPQDVVIITGKGSEPWMCVAKGKKVAWDDRQIVREEFQNMG